MKLFFTSVTIVTMELEEKELFIDFKDFKTYVKIVNPNGKNPPLIILHGGPGSTHNSLELIKPIAALSDRPLVYYDQIGCGYSSKPDHLKDEIYNKDFWIDELQNLLDTLNVKTYHLLGHSWGGMLAQLFILKKKPTNILSLILSSTLSSATLWKEETHKLIEKLSKEDQEAIKEAEANNDYTHQAFLDASNRYMKLTVSDYSPDDPSLPECLRRLKIRGNVAYLTAWGPSEFAPTGNLKDYETSDLLNAITTPTLVCYGSLDESTKKQNELMYNSLGSKKKKILVFQNARHMTYFECNKDYINEINEWIVSND